MIDLTLYPKNNAHGQPYVGLCCDQLSIKFTHIRQGYFTGTKALKCVKTVSIGFV